MRIIIYIYKRMRIEYWKILILNINKKIKDINKDISKVEIKNELIRIITYINNISKEINRERLNILKLYLLRYSNLQKLNIINNWKIIIYSFNKTELINKIIRNKVIINLISSLLNKRFKIRTLRENVSNKKLKRVKKDRIWNWIIISTPIIKENLSKINISYYYYLPNYKNITKGITILKDYLNTNYFNNKSLYNLRGYTSNILINYISKNRNLYLFNKYLYNKNFNNLLFISKLINNNKLYPSNFKVLNNNDITINKNYGLIYNNKLNNFILKNKSREYLLNKINTLIKLNPNSNKSKLNNNNQQLFNYINNIFINNILTYLHFNKYNLLISKFYNYNSYINNIKSNNNLLINNNNSLINNKLNNSNISKNILIDENVNDNIYSVLLEYKNINNNHKFNIMNYNIKNMNILKYIYMNKYISRDININKLSKVNNIINYINMDNTKEVNNNYIEYLFNIYDNNRNMDQLFGLINTNIENVYKYKNRDITLSNIINMNFNNSNKELEIVGIPLKYEYNNIEIFNKVLENSVKGKNKKISRKSSFNLLRRIKIILNDINSNKDINNNNTNNNLLLEIRDNRKLKELLILKRLLGASYKVKGKVGIKSGKKRTTERSIILGGTFKNTLINHKFKLNTTKPNYLESKISKYTNEGSLSIKAKLSYI